MVACSVCGPSEAVSLSLSLSVGVASGVVLRRVFLPPLQSSYKRPVDIARPWIRSTRVWSAVRTDRTSLTQHALDVVSLAYQCVVI